MWRSTIGKPCESSCRNYKQCANALVPHESGEIVQQVKISQSSILKDLNIQLHRDPKIWASAFLFSAYTKGSPLVHLSQEQISTQGPETGTVQDDTRDF